MAVDAESMSRRIVAARDRAGLSQTQLAVEIALDRSALAKIENGSRRVSALELAKIAEAVGERIEWFVMETPAAIVSHRNMHEPAASSPSIDREVERITWNTEFVVEHCEKLKLASMEPMTRPATGEEAEKSAISVRRILELGDRNPFDNMSSRIEKLGLLTFSTDMGPDSADAASILLKQGGVALINGHLRVGRRRLALAHEFGHYLFADEYTVDWRIEAKEDDNAWESRLDRFARAILLPAAGISEFWRERSATDESLRTSAVRAASIFRVDMSTLARRLSELSIVSQSDSAQIRTFKTTRADIVELDLVPNDELASPFLARSYQEAVLHLYRQEVVSPARATDLLFDTWEEADLPTLPELPESATWNFV